MRLEAKVLAPLILLALISLCAYSYFEMENHEPYPGTDEIRSNYQAYIGKQVSIFGDVTEIDQHTVTISSDGLNFKTQSLNAAIGDKVEIIGVLQEDYNITISNSLVYDRLGYYSVFLRSLAGVALLAFLFLKSWKFDARKFRFTERG